MKTRAALLLETGAKLQVTEIDVDPPKAGEVMIRMVSSGLCHSDEHFRDGTFPVRTPCVTGHEGAGIVEMVGEGVQHLVPGDHVVLSFLPVCGHCRWCSRGQTNLCDLGANILDGQLLDGTYRFHHDGLDAGGACMLGTFSEFTTVSQFSCVKVEDKSVPLAPLALIGCGVPTGFGSAAYATNIEPGDTVVIFGSGGVGMNAVQGARIRSALNVVVVDPSEFKRESSKRFGATHTFATAEEAQEAIRDLTRGVGADSAIVTAGVVTEEILSNAIDSIRKAGTVVVTDEKNIHTSGAVLAMYAKRIQGAVYGNCNPFEEIPRLISLYTSGQLMLDELITQEYTLDEVNQGYEDMLNNKNIRGLIRF
jgi:S-(hydroxymethyl)glutathione dehydrogenase/alcohol dehydrogenase